jgi:flagellar biosynthesis protein FlhF
MFKNVTLNGLKLNGLKLSRPAPDGEKSKGLRLKSYFSGTVEAAIELARKELGEDALLVNARLSTPETRSLGTFEVVFGIAEAAPELPSPAVPQAPPPQLRHLVTDVADLRREIERMAQMMRDSRLTHQAAAPYPATDSETYADLLRGELDPVLAAQVAGGTQLDTLYEVDATLGRPGGSRAVVAVVGPPGAGKTTTLVKLAARYGLASRRPSQVITADVHRISAADQLRCLASILGIGCDVVETPVALAQALEEHRGKDFVFIDTPGLGSADMNDGADLARFLGSHPEIDVHLVLPASMRAADLARVIERYQIFRPGKLLFTRLDETETFGVLVTEAARRSLPISFLATGQQIPDDLEPATKQRLTALLLAGPGELMQRPGELIQKGAAA